MLKNRELVTHGLNAMQRLHGEPVRVTAGEGRAPEPTLQVLGFQKWSRCTNGRQMGYVPSFCRR
ncbi:MAG TPA: hypothetical protein VK040_07080 [Balneolaceae bacterium]|nr:hypothetical protein [Balneolaceae bacterium]